MLAAVKQAGNPIWWKDMEREDEDPDQGQKPKCVQQIKLVFISQVLLEFLDT